MNKIHQTGAYTEVKSFPIDSPTSGFISKDSISRVVLLVALVLCFWFQQAQAASVVGVVQQSASTQALDLPGAEADYYYTFQDTSGPVSKSYTSPGGFAKAHNSASHGILKLAVSRVSPVAPHPIYFDMYSHTECASYWQDVVQIDSPGLTGQIGWVTVAFTIDGSTSSGGSTQIEDIRYRFSYGEANSVYDSEVGELVRGVGILNNQRTHQIPFVFGTPFSMALTISARVGSLLDVPGQAIVNLSHTQTWGGFLSVTTGAGETVSYTTSSASGTNFSQPILSMPEPVLNPPTLTFEGGRVIANFNGVPGHTYTIQRSTTLAPDSWEDLDTQVAPTFGGIQFIDPVPPADCAFYRVMRP
jgi:hypothetical protein